jgi:glycosyltransferase involved in cell wall biosynthesis
MNQAGTEPAISVIMAIYNGAADAPKAIHSILNQTYADLELIAINDGSHKDDTRTVLDGLSQSLADPRLRVVHLDKNLGLAGALNHGIGFAQGRYIARQDHDDIAFPTRLEKQIAFMEANPKCGLLGTASEIWVNDAPSGRWHDHPTRNAELQVFLLSNNPFVHSSVMMRREVINRCGLYTTDRNRQPPEDFEFWSRIARTYEVRNLAERLVAYREVAGSISRVPDTLFRERLVLISAENIAFWNGLKKPTVDCFTAAALAHAAYTRVSPDAKIEPVIALLKGAVRRIAEKYPGHDLSGAQDQLIKTALDRFVRARPIPFWAKPILSATRKLPIPIDRRQRLLEWLTN